MTDAEPMGGSSLPKRESDSQARRAAWLSRNGCGRKVGQSGLGGCATKRFGLRANMHLMHLIS